MNTVTEKSVLLSVFGRRFISITRTVRQELPLPATAPTDRPVVRPAPASRPTVFLINSLFLRDCFRLLTKTADEGLHVVTGTKVRHLRTLERIVPVALSRQSVAGAAADDQSLAEELMKLNDFGMLPLAYFHSHPGRGIDATVPSGTDRRTQAVMEEAGAEIIGAIFSRDGYVRFFANAADPKVKVLGKKIKEVSANVFQLETDG